MRKPLARARFTASEEAASPAQRKMRHSASSAPRMTYDTHSFRNRHSSESSCDRYATQLAP